MATKGKRARDADRNVTVDALTDAYADGQLTHEEYDTRVDQALAARHLTALHGLTRDLQGVPTQLPSDPTPASSTTAAVVPSDGIPARYRGRIAAGVIAAVLAVILLPRVFGTEEQEATPAGSDPARVDLLAEGAYEQLVADLDDSLEGPPVVFSAVVSRDSASFELPIDRSSDRYHLVRYDAEGWEETDQVGTSQQGRLDLLRIDPEDIENGVRTAEELVEDAERDRTSVVFSAPDPGVEEPRCFSVLTSNRFGEDASVSYTCNGREVSRRGPQD